MNGIKTIEAKFSGICGGGCVYPIRKGEKCAYIVGLKGIWHFECARNKVAPKCPDCEWRPNDGGHAKWCVRVGGDGLSPAAKKRAALAVKE